MRIVGSFDPSMSTSGTIAVGAADSGAKVLLYNLSLVNLKLDFEDGNTALLHAGEANYWTLENFTPEISWDQFSILNAAQPAISEVSIVVYDAGEQLDGTYPMSLIHQINVGNPSGVNTNTVSSTANSITNDGSAVGATLIESTATGQTSSSIKLTNDGLLALNVIIAGALVQAIKTQNSGSLLQLGAAGKIVEIINNLLVDGALTVNGAISTDGGTITTDGSGDLTINNGKIASAAGTNIQFFINGSSQGFITGGGGLNTNTYLNAGSNLRVNGTNVIGLSGTTTLLESGGGPVKISGVSLEFQDNSLLNQVHGFSGTGTGTFNHSCTSTPNNIQLTTNATGSTQTMGYDTVTSTQVHVTTGSSFAWRGLALVLA